MVTLFSSTRHYAAITFNSVLVTDNSSIYWVPNDTSFIKRRLQPNYVQSCQKGQIIGEKQVCRKAANRIAGCLGV